MQGPSTTFANVVRLLGAFVATSVVLGLLGAGLIMPAVGATGAAARQGVSAFDALPSEFTSSPLSQQSRILDINGNTIATPYDENRIIVPLAKVAPIMRTAQVAIEDSRFYEHGGIDIHGVVRAAATMIGGGDKQGASTLTQQLVKLTLQEQALRNDDAAAAEAAVARNGAAGVARKLQELKYAVTLEKTLTKDQILEAYLNLAYYGDRAYGVEAAAEHYFNTTAAKLTLPQAALLAGLVQQPGISDPVHFPDRALARRNVVLDRMHELGLITDQAWKSAHASKIVLNVQPEKNSCANSPYPYFCNYVMDWLMQQPALGNSVAERIDRINRGGLTIQTTLDPKVMALAQKQLTAKVPVANSEGIGAAAAVVEPGTGKVLAIVQNTTYANTTAKGKTAVDWATDHEFGGSNGFQFGSTAKMFAIAEALKQGMPVNSTVDAPPSGTTFYPSDFPDKCRPGPAWTVSNDEPGSVGRVSLTKMTEQSINTAFVKLGSQLGVCSIAKTMNDMGLHSAVTGKPIPSEYTPSNIILGSGTVSPVTLASAYATVAAGGKYCVPTPVASITTNDKKQLKLTTPSCRQALDPDVAAGVVKVLSTVLKSGTAAGNELDNNRPASGKTGTTEENRQSWFAGFTPQLSTAVWVGTPYTQRRMKNIKLAGQYYGTVFGATIAAPIWKGIMDGASAGMPIRPFPNPSSKVEQGDLVTIPNVSGLSIADASAQIEGAGFSVTVGPSTNSSISQGNVVYTSPSGQALRGSTVVLYPSTGYVPQAQTTPTPAPSTTPTSPPTTKPAPTPKPTPSKTHKPPKSPKPPKP